MYIKNIYDEWKLHHDATQLEINYNFLIKFIDILDVESLSKNVNDQSIIITDNIVLREWKIYTINRILSQFKDISIYVFPDAEWFSHSKLFVKTIFMAGDILNALKITNYKASELSSYYEPKLFLFAQKYLDLEVFEEWVSMLSKRVFDNWNKTITVAPKKFDWALSTNASHIKNVVWHVENLLLNFKDITIWFNHLRTDKKLFNTKKSTIINIMNHMIIYGLTDFYAKYYTEITGFNYLTIYQSVLSEIAIDVSNQSFAVVSFKQLSFFLNSLLNQHILMPTDAMINNFLEFIKISCSIKNVDILKQYLFKPNELGSPVYKVDLNEFADSYLAEAAPIHNSNVISPKDFDAHRLKNATTRDKLHDEKDEVAGDIPVVSYKITKNEDLQIPTTSLEQQATSVLGNLTKPFHLIKNKFIKTHTYLPNNGINNIKEENAQIEMDFSKKEVDEYE